MLRIVLVAAAALACMTWAGDVSASPLRARTRGAATLSPEVASPGAAATHAPGALRNPHAAALLASASSASSSSATWAELPENERLWFPSVCPTSDRACCPAPSDLLHASLSSSLTCGGHGQCTTVTADDATCDMSRHGSGLWWFTQYFDRVCVCDVGWTGAACERCAPGFGGDDCSPLAQPRVRRDYGQLTLAQRQQVVRAFVLLKASPSPFWGSKLKWFDWFATLHKWSMCQFPVRQEVYNTTTNTTTIAWIRETSDGRATTDWIDDVPAIYDPVDSDAAGSRFCYAHMSSGTPTWHRRMLLEIEYAMQFVLQDDSFALPYWRWWGAQESTRTLLDDFGGDGDPDWDATDRPYCRVVSTDYKQPQIGSNCTLRLGAFANWTVMGPWGRPRSHTLKRCFACHQMVAPSLPSQAAYDCIVRQDRWDSAPYNTSSPVGFRAMIDGSQLCDNHTLPVSAGKVDMHARVHSWVGGTLVGYDPASEPLFYMLHGGYDYAMEEWMRRAVAAGRWSADTNGMPVTGSFRGQHRFECMGGWFPLQQHDQLFVANASRAFGYTFDTYELDDNGV